MEFVRHAAELPWKHARKHGPSGFVLAMTLYPLLLLHCLMKRYCAEAERNICGFIVEDKRRYACRYASMYLTLLHVYRSTKHHGSDVFLIFFLFFLFSIFIRSGDECF